MLEVAENATFILLIVPLYNAHHGSIPIRNAKSMLTCSLQSHHKATHLANAPPLTAGRKIKRLHRTNRWLKLPLRN